MRRARTALATAVVAALVGLLLLPGSAAAHTPLVASNPPADTIVDLAPDHVVLEFEEPVAADDDSVVVTDSDGKDRAVGVLRSINGRLVSVVVDPLGPSGEWQVDFQVRGDDGHLVDGSFGFGVGEGATLAAGTGISPLSAVAVILLVMTGGFLVLAPRLVRSVEGLR